jgi:6-phosphogluconate dehydrogenase
MSSENKTSWFSFPCGVIPMRYCEGAGRFLFLPGIMAVSNTNQSDVGVIGLNVIGRNAVLLLADHQFNVATMDWGGPTTSVQLEQTTGTRVRLAANVVELMAGLRQPRTILVFSGGDVPMNLVLDQLLPDLKRGDLVMDAGDSFFKHTAKHDRQLAERGIQFLGIGLDVGQQGARQGAVVMAGGGREARQRTRPLLEALAATMRGEPCVSYFENAAAAHFVKMVHTGAEYALLQSLAETFDLLQRALLLSDEELHDALGAWHIGFFNGYLMEICGRAAEPADQQSPRMLLEEKLRSAKNDALGRWAARSAWELEVPAPTIEAAAGTQRVAAIERRQALLDAPFRQPVGRAGDDPESVLEELHGAFQAAMLITYAQAMAMLAAASENLGFQFRLHEISRAWRGGTRLRTGLLDDITAALQTTPNLPGLLSDDDLSERVMACQENLRQAVWRAGELDTPVPALLASLDYLDSNKAAWLPVNLIQVPRREPGRAGVQVR